MLSLDKLKLQLKRKRFWSALKFSVQALSQLFPSTLPFTTSTNSYLQIPSEAPGMPRAISENPLPWFSGTSKCLHMNITACTGSVSHDRVAFPVHVASATSGGGGNSRRLKQVESVFVRRRGVAAQALPGMQIRKLGWNSWCPGVHVGGDGDVPRMGPPMTGWNAIKLSLSFVDEIIGSRAVCIVFISCIAGPVLHFWFHSRICIHCCNDEIMVDFNKKSFH